MAWRARLLPGSFRGQRFEVQAHEADAAGRRVKVHEYPGRDEPYAEDLGRITGRWEIEAYVVGADYDVRRDALVAACAEAGPGTLVHPYLGTRQVMCVGCKLSERTSEGGVARLALAFVAAGVNRYPAARADTRSAVDSAAAAARTAVRNQVVAALCATSASLPSFVTEAEAAAVRQIADAIGTPAAAKLAAEADQLVHAPEDLADRIFEAVGEVTGDGALEVLAQFTLPAVPRTTANRRAQAACQDALVFLERAAAATELAQRTASRSFADRGAAGAARDAVRDRIDGLAADAGDGAYGAFRGLQTAVVEHVASASADLPSLTTAAPATIQTSLATSYAIYGDISHAGDIAARNRLPRPGFVPARPIEVAA